MKRLLCRKIALRVRAGAARAVLGKLGLVNLDFTGKGPCCLHRHLHRSAPQVLIDPLAGLTVDPSQIDLSAATSDKTSSITP